jgi:N-acetyl-anhydromuramyl-L-alanine amidase AmpD
MKQVHGYKIIEKHLPIAHNVRPDQKRAATKALIVHWTGVRQHPSVTWDWLASGKYASPHVVIFHKEVWEFVPIEMVGWHGGAVDPSNYTRLARDSIGIPPYLTTVAAELVPEDIEDGHFAEDTVETFLQWGRDVCKRFLLNPIHCLWRHYDLTGKVCPKWWVEHSDEWAKTRLKLYEMVVADSEFDREHKHE